MCALKTVSTQALEFPHASVSTLFWLDRTCRYTSDSATRLSVPMLTVWNSLPILRVYRCVWLCRTWTCNSLALAKRVPYYTISQYKPSLFIKPAATGNGYDDYFERSRASGSKRSTWKMKKMWLVAPAKLELAYLSALDFESSVSTISTMGRYFFHSIALSPWQGSIGCYIPFV